MMTRMAVAGPSKLATGAAGRIVAGGGNVVDAAVVSTLTAMCTEPGVCAPGGGGFLTIDVPGKSPATIDGYVAYPGQGFDGEATMQEVRMDYGGGLTTFVGAGSIAVPGVFAGLELASKMFGRAPWRDLMEVVAGVVENGFPMGKAARDYLVEAGELIPALDETARKALFDGDRLRDVGEMVVYEGLASTLRYIGEHGSEVFYRGDLGEAIVADLQARGGRLTRLDLGSYQAIARSPLSLEMRGWKLDVNPPPAVGGVTVALALNEIARAQGAGPGVWANALVSAFRTRLDELEAPAGREGAAVRALARAGLRSPSTISIAVADEDGGAVAGTASAGYGSGVAPAGASLMMNNAVGEIELTPGGVGAGIAGDRMMSNMAPTVARKGADVVAIGTPGADRITSALVMTLEWLMCGLNLSDAIEHPRVHPEFGEWGIRVAAEPGLRLDSLDYPIRLFEAPHMYFGGVNGAALEGGDLHGHADSRREGAVALVG